MVVVGLSFPCKNLEHLADLVIDESRFSLRALLLTLDVVDRLGMQLLMVVVERGLVLDKDLSVSNLGVGGVNIGVLDPVFQTCLDTVELRLFNFFGDGFEYSFPVLLATDIVFPFLETSLSFDVVKALEVICKHVVRLVRQFILQKTVFPRVR